MLLSDAVREGGELLGGVPMLARALNEFMLCSQPCTGRRCRTGETKGSAADVVGKLLVGCLLGPAAAAYALPCRQTSLAAKRLHPPTRVAPESHQSRGGGRTSSEEKEIPGPATSREATSGKTLAQ